MISNLFQLDIDNKTSLIFITSIIWAINFRSTFKNIDSHMDSGSYASLKYEYDLILIKNIICCFFFIGLYIELKLNKSQFHEQKQIIKERKGDMIIFEIQRSKNRKRDSLLNTLFILNNLKKSKEKIFFFLKMYLIIFIIYIIEELYFIISNNHILDRLICPIRNLGILVALMISSPFFIKKTWGLYKHQYIPLIIIFILSALIIFFNALRISRFEKIFGLNFIVYLFTFFLIGLESVLIKYLVDVQSINIFFILGMKGITGTIIFSIIKASSTLKNFFNFFDYILNFEYDEMYEEFHNAQKAFYIISLVALQYFKIFIIIRFTESHLLSVLMLTDIIYFPLYCLERFTVQQFTISTISTFILNNLLGFINLFLMLIFNEILECKFWGINTNLKKNINKRQIDEIMISLEGIHPNTNDERYSDSDDESDDNINEKNNNDRQKEE